MNTLTIGFIGLGLIGGSVARAIRHFHPDIKILAYTPDKAALTYALENNMIDNACTAVDDSYRQCDYIFLCAPVEININYLEILKPIIKEHCLVTDIGSTKAAIHKEVTRLDMERNFIGGHPMAGSEKNGLKNAKRILIENAYYVLTPTKKTDPQMLADYEVFIRSLSALPLVLDYEEHDSITAAISHLPHLIASSLVNLIKMSDNKQQTMKLIAAGGFKDITRIASSSPEMWTQICSSNRDKIATILNTYIDNLSSVHDSLLAAKDSDIYELFDTSRDYRNSIGDSTKGPIIKNYAIYCDMVDEAGGIAALATILATNSISIKNIGIVHNREFEEGVLHVEFYAEEARQKAVELLRRYRYTIYERR